MTDDYFIVNQVTRTDRPEEVAYEVVGFDGWRRVTFHPVNKSSAEWLAKCLNDRSAVEGFTVDSHGDNQTLVWGQLPKEPT